MSREEAIRLTLCYLTERDDEHAPVLDYGRMLQSLTEYTSCWYVDFWYRQQNSEQLPGPRSEAPGFTIDKEGKYIRLVSWQQLYELNWEPLPV